MKKNDIWIRYINLSRQFVEEKRLLFQKLKESLSSGKYILSDEVEKFEKDICNYQNMKFCISVNSGTDALILSLLSINIKSGDEVITQANSYIASAAAINAVGAKPIFCDVIMIKP